MKVLGLLGLMFFSCWSGLASANYTDKWCVSDDPGKCTVKPTYGCPQDGGPGAGDLAKQACTIHSADGEKVLDYRIKTVSSDSGGKCGISVYEVTCIEK